MCKKINRFFPIFMIVYVFGSMLIGTVIGSMKIEVPMWASLLISQALIVIPVLVFACVERISITKCLPYRMPAVKDAMLSLLFGYLLLPAILLINFISMFFSNNYIETAAVSISNYPFIIQLLLMAVMPACVEEFAFRGIFYHSYRKNGILPAALLSGFLFGLVHMNINQFLYACVIGIVFALLVEATQSMFSAMIAHFAVNSYSIILMNVVPSSLEQSEASKDIIANMGAGMIAVEIIIFGTLALVFGILAFLVFRCLAKRNGSWETIQLSFKAGLKSQNGERFVTFPLIITVILCVAYIIITEFFV